MKKPSIEPDDGYEMDKECGDHPWEYWEKQREEWLDREYPGLFDMVCRLISDIGG